jgi:uncharacterized protein (DUF952 family)
VIHHLALRSDWDSARAAGEYRVSTLGVTLEQEGFIHTSFAHQVPATAERYYAHVTEPLVLLVIDEARLTALGVPWQVDVAPRTGEGFPHVYAPIPVEAVVSVTPVGRAADGSWTGLPT